MGTVTAEDDTPVAVSLIVNERTLLAEATALVGMVTCALVLLGKVTVGAGDWTTPFTVSAAVSLEAK